MIFLNTTLTLILTLMAATAFGLFRGEPLPSFVFATISWGSITWLAFLGWFLSRHGRVQLTAVSITVQGYGVFSLIMGLASGFRVLLHGGKLAVHGDLSEFAPMIWPVAEGLIGAGWATILVVLLRLYQSLIIIPEGGREPPGSGGGAGLGGTVPPEYAKVSAAVAALVSELERARSQASGMADSVTKVTALMNGLGTMLENLDRFFTEKV